MSTDYYLYSPSHRRCVMVGSDSSLSGPKSWPVEYGGREFIKWAIDNSVRDIVLVDEHSLPDGDGIQNDTHYRNPPY